MKSRVGAWAELEQIDRAFSTTPKVTMKGAVKERSGDSVDSVRDGVMRLLHTPRLGPG